MRIMMLPVLGFAAALAFVGTPAVAQETCASKAAKMQETLALMAETSQEKQNIQAQITEGLSKCNANANDPWINVDKRVNK